MSSWCMLLLVSAILDACVCAYIHLAYIHLLHSELPRCCQFASVCVSLRLRAKLVAVYCSPGNWQLRQSVVMAHELGNCSSFRRSLPFTFNSFCSLHRDSRPFTFNSFNSFCSLHRDSRPFTFNNSSFSKASVLVAMYAFYLKHYVYTGAQARRPMPHATSPMSHAFIPPDARSTLRSTLRSVCLLFEALRWQPYPLVGSLTP